MKKVEVELYIDTWNRFIKADGVTEGHISHGILRVKTHRYIFFAKKNEFDEV